MNPSGLCKCGCGETTRPYPQNRVKEGWVKGEPSDYKAGHWSRTSQALPTLRKNAAQSRKLGPLKAGATQRAKAALRKLEAQP